jgi:hypothetical protein
MGKSKKSAANHEKWIGFRDNIQETPIFHHISWENHGNPWFLMFPVDFPLN